MLMGFIYIYIYMMLWEYSRDGIHGINFTFNDE